ncbi:hypothetical protein GO495_06685 [Chitinophaga oryziterrae]|uniref:Uncharacterized protein n=1 Tax=Chitinophaga oryziterrae TaxID=1031224 RepID=A0A6N8J6K5_9BACT|nr:hypothetical protein [Chitinophaga oryziterrae]MVT40261.1 hypothetical protein [Chitinophaga oryziterrae]
MEIYKPIHLLNKELLDRMISSGYQYFIRQKMSGGRGYFIGYMKAVLILTHYKDKKEALQHLVDIQGIDHRKLYDTNNDTDLQNLYAMSAQPEGYAVFTSLLDPDTWTPPTNFEEKMYKYLQARNIQANKDELRGIPEFVQGILFVDIYTGAEIIRVPFHDVR